jgi:hypothetical protein
MTLTVAGGKLEVEDVSIEDLAPDNLNKSCVSTFYHPQATVEDLELTPAIPGALPKDPQDTFTMLIGSDWKHFRD